MSLFSKLFGKKSEFEPQNQLEKLLQEAVNNPSKRAEFLKKLFHFDLIVLGSLDRRPEGDAVQFVTRNNSEGIPYIYAFTSQAAMEYVVTKSSLPPSQKFVGLKATALFEMLKGQMGIHLNAGLPFGKFFYPQEISDILAGKLERMEEKTITAGTNYFVGQPAKRPEGLVEALAQYLKENAGLTDIYFGLHTFLDSGARSGPSYLVALEFTSEAGPKNISQESNNLGQVFSSLKLNFPVDFTVAQESHRELVKKGALLSVKSVATL